MKTSLHSFGTDAGFVSSFPETHGNEARSNIVRCPYLETCKRYGRPEITRCFCDGDDAGNGNLHPKLNGAARKPLAVAATAVTFY